MNIDLASFNINTDQLFQKLVQTRTEIDRVKASQAQLRAEFATANKSVTDNQKALDNLNTRLQGLTLGTQSYTDTLSQRDQAEQRLNDSLLQQSTINANYQEQLTQTSLELNRLNNQSRSYQSVLDAQNRATNESIDLYTRQRAELSLLQREQREMGATLIQMESNGEQNTQAFRELTTAYNNASERAGELATSLREVDQAGGNLTSNIGNYRSALEDFKTALFNGDTQGLRTSFDQITTSIKGIITQSLAFIATPIGAVIAGIAGAVAILASGFDNFKKFQQGLADLSAITGASGKDLEYFRKEAIELGKSTEGGATAVVEAYKLIGSAKPELLNNVGALNEVTKATLTLAKASGLEMPAAATALTDAMNQFGADASEANRFIDALANGAKFGAAEIPQVTEAMLKFGAVAKNSNVNVEESTALIELLAEKGLKGADAGTALRNVLLKISAPDALPKRAQEELSKLGISMETLSNKSLPVQDKLEALKPILKDNASLVKVFGLENAVAATNVIGNTDRLRELTKVMYEQGTAQEQANTRSETINGTFNRLKETWNSFLLTITSGSSIFGDAIKGLLEFVIKLIDGVSYLGSEFGSAFGEIYSAIEPVIDLIKISLANSFEGTKATFKVFFDLLVTNFKIIGNAISTFVKVAKALLSGDFSGALNAVKQGFINFGNIVSGTFGRIKNTIIDGIKGIISNVKPLLSALGFDVEKLQKKLDNLKYIDPKKVNTQQNISGKVGSQGATEEDFASAAGGETKIQKKNREDAVKAREEEQKKRDDALKKELDSAQKLADEKVKLAALELNTYIEKNKSILDNEKFLTSELLKQEQERLKNIEKAKIEQEKLEFETQDKKLQLQIDALANKTNLNQTEKNELETLRTQQKELEIQYTNDVVKIKEDTQKQINATETRYSNERIEAEKVRRAIQYQTEILDLEAKGATEQEIKLAQQEQTYQLELEKYAQKLQDEFQIKLDTDANNQITQAEIDKVQQELEKELANEKDENEKIRVQNQLDALNNIETANATKKVLIVKASEKEALSAISDRLGQAGALFKENTAVFKAMAIAQIGINTFLNATEAYKAGLKAATALGAGAIAAPAIATGFSVLAIAQGVSSAAKVAGIGFSDGGYTGDGSKYTPAGIVHKGEVVFSQADVKALGGASIVNSMRPTFGVPGFATGGVVGSPIASLSNIQNQFTSGLNSEVLTEAIRSAVLEGSAIGTATGSQRGISDLNNNNYIASTANF